MLKDYPGVTLTVLSITSWDKDVRRLVIRCNVSSTPVLAMFVDGGLKGEPLRGSRSKAAIKKLLEG